MKIVLVDWLDCSGNLNWLTRDEAEAKLPVKCQTIGYLIASKRDRIVVAATCDELHKYNDVSVIPRNSVTKITHLGATNK